MTKTSPVDFQPETYIKVHQNIRFHPQLTYGERFFLMEIASICKKKRVPFTSRDLSKYFGVSHQTVLNWVKKMVNMDILIVGVDYKSTECRQYIELKLYPEEWIFE